MTYHIDDSYEQSYHYVPPTKKDIILQKLTELRTRTLYTNPDYDNRIFEAKLIKISQIFHNETFDYSKINTMISELENYEKEAMINAVRKIINNPKSNPKDVDIFLSSIVPDYPLNNLLTQAIVRERLDFIQFLLKKDPNLLERETPWASKKTMFDFYLQHLRTKLKEPPEKMPEEIKMKIFFEQGDNAKIFCFIYQHYITELFKKNDKKVFEVLNSFLKILSKAPENVIEIYKKETLPALKAASLASGNLSIISEADKTFHYSYKELAEANPHHHIKELVIRNDRRAVQILASSLETLPEASPTIVRFYNEKMLPELKAAFLASKNPSIVAGAHQIFHFTPEELVTAKPFLKTIQDMPQKITEFATAVEKDAKLKKSKHIKVIESCADKITKLNNSTLLSTSQKILSMLDELIKAHNDIRKTYLGKTKLFTKGSTNAEKLLNYIKEICTGLSIKLKMTKPEQYQIDNDSINTSLIDVFDEVSPKFTK